MGRQNDVSRIVEDHDLHTRIKEILKYAHPAAKKPATARPQSNTCPLGKNATACPVGKRRSLGDITLRDIATWAAPWIRPISDSQVAELRAVARAVSDVHGVPINSVWADLKRKLKVRRIEQIPRHAFRAGRRHLLAELAAPQPSKTNVVRLDPSGPLRLT